MHWACAITSGLPPQYPQQHPQSDLEFLYWGMNWDIEHYMYGGVSFYHLRKLHQALTGDMPEPRTLLGAWREMVAIWRR